MTAEELAVILAKPKLTAQEVFDTAVTKLLEQNKQSVDEDNGLCMYRGSDNTCCAVGWLIPDDIYTPEMETKSAELLLEEGYLPDNLIPHVDLLNKMQAIHDGYSEEHWNMAYENLAIEKDLEWKFDEPSNASTEPSL